MRIRCRPNDGDWIDWVLVVLEHFSSVVARPPTLDYSLFSLFMEKLLFIFIIFIFIWLIVGPRLLYVLRTHALSSSQQEEPFLSASPQQSVHLWPARELQWSGQHGATKVIESVPQGISLPTQDTSETIRSLINSSDQPPPNLSLNLVMTIFRKLWYYNHSVDYCWIFANFIY